MTGDSQPFLTKAQPPVVTLGTFHFGDGEIERANTPKHTLQYRKPNTENRIPNTAWYHSQKLLLTSLPPYFQILTGLEI